MDRKTENQLRQEIAEVWALLDAERAGRAALIRRIEQEEQSVAVVGEPTDAAYKWMIANGVEPMTSLHKLGERLAAFLDEDQFSGCETLLLTAITAINTFVPVPAAELATLREKAAMADELRKALLALKEDCQTSNDCQYGTLSTSHVARIVDAAIAQGKGE